MDLIYKMTVKLKLVLFINKRLHQGIMIVKIFSFLTDVIGRISVEYRHGSANALITVTDRNGLRFVSRFENITVSKT